MIEERSGALDSIFHALSDRTRRAMLRSLAAGEHNIGALAAPHRMSFAAASKHVKVLEKAGLVRRRIKGRAHICRIEPALLASAGAWLRFYEHFWADTLGRLLGSEDEAASARSKGVAKL
jgi:DNA-binding transcriptional ArsR family regulator